MSGKQLEHEEHGISFMKVFKVLEKSIVPRPHFENYHAPDRFNNPEGKNDDELRVSIKMALIGDCERSYSRLENGVTFRDPNLFETAFKVLTLLDLLTPKERDLFYALYILRGLHNGVIFNEAQARWNPWGKISLEEST